jgi:gamma-glutamylcyclotransferase (GGCT)/AIG2-like uncharacterized protein YtfP
MNTRVFVYGTLLSGLGNHDLLKDSELIAKDVLLGGFQMYDVGYFPACIHTGNMNDTIIGEIYKINKKTLERLDFLEGYPDHYNRIQISDMKAPTWIYMWETMRDNLEQVWSGNWRQCVETKKSRV